MATRMVQSGLKSLRWFREVTVAEPVSLGNLGGRDAWRASAQGGPTPPITLASRDRSQLVAPLVATSANRLPYGIADPGMAMPARPQPGLLNDFVSETSSQASETRSAPMPQAVVQGAPAGPTTPPGLALRDAQGPAPWSAHVHRQAGLENVDVNVGRSAQGFVVGNHLDIGRQNIASPAAIHLSDPHLVQGTTTAFTSQSHTPPNAASLRGVVDPHARPLTMVAPSAGPDQIALPQQPSAVPSGPLAGPAAPHIGMPTWLPSAISSIPDKPTWEVDTCEAYYLFRDSYRSFQLKYGNLPLESCISGAVCRSLLMKLHAINKWTDVSDLRVKIRAISPEEFFEVVASVANPDHLRRLNTEEVTDLDCGPMPKDRSGENPFPLFFAKFYSVMETDRAPYSDMITKFLQAFKKHHKNEFTVFSDKAKQWQSLYPTDDARRFELLYSYVEDHFARTYATLKTYAWTQDSGTQQGRSRRFQRAGNGAGNSAGSGGRARPATPAPSTSSTTSNIAAVGATAQASGQRKKKKPKNQRTA